tara:strand:+ start:612 stop:995 length:384 start_codon:yes stop_codon:yes gene_type:complete
MLAKFRNKNIGSFSTLLVIVAIMVKMMVPIAHAAASDQKSFFARLCSGHQVLITINLTDKDQTASSIKNNKKCPLCSTVAQDTLTNILTQPSLVFPTESNRFFTNHIASFSNDALGLQSIRAPPTHA